LARATAWRSSHRWLEVEAEQIREPPISDPEGRLKTSFHSREDEEDVFSLTDQPIDARALQTRLNNPSAGGRVTFEGWVRDRNEGRAVESLDYEAYEALAIKEGESVVREARERFSIIEARCVHRVGHLEIGEMAVWVGVSAAHRDAAFEACRYIIDEIKARVPIWKREAYADGRTG
jgi:molybdopterin synthase catalytic subunit